jgi:hypothetical protein
MIFDQSHPLSDICQVSILSKRNTVGIVKESTMRYILYCLGIDCPIRDKYYFSSQIGDLGIVECDLFNDTLIYYTSFDMETDDLSYLKCSR